MGVEITDLDRLQSFYAHAAAQKGTENLHVEAVGVALKALQDGKTVTEAFDLADRFADQAKEARKVG